MAKVKVSEWSATPGSNTDIDGINIAEGCSPSGINDAIREMMSQIKDWQSGASGDSLTIGAAGSLTLSGGTANGIPYLNGSKVLTSGSALTFNGTLFEVAAASATAVGKFSHTGDLASGAVVIGDPATASAITSIYLRSTTKANINFAAGGVLAFNGAGDGSTERMRIDSSGNLGLGVTPTQAFSTSRAFQIGGGLIEGRTNDSITFSLASNAYLSAAGNWTYKSNNRASLFELTNGAYAWKIAGAGTGTISFTQAMTLDASGNLLVGTTSSTAPNPGFSVYVAGAGNTQAIIGHSTASGSGQAYITFQYNGATTIGSITQNGTTAVAYNTTSDHRLKNNVRNADALRFKDIRFVDFEWIDGRHDCGVIAHELQAIYPDLVVGAKDETEVRTVELTPAVPAVLDEEGNVVTPEVPAVTEEQTFDKHQQVNYIGLIPRMGTVIQQLMAEVEAMKAEIAALKAAP